MQQPAPPATASAAVGLPDDPFYMSSSRTANGSTAAAAAAGTSKAPNAAAATGGPAAHAAPAVQPLPPHAAISVGFNSWVSSLYPSQEEKPGGRWGAVLQAVQEVLHMKQSGQLWSVAAIHKVGSFQRSTNLRGS
jgi:hypothetical protein